MKKFNPEMKVVRFGNEDVIATSGIPNSFTLTNFKDGHVGNGSMKFNNNTYSNNEAGANDFLYALSGYGYTLDITNDNSSIKQIRDILATERDSDIFDSAWDGGYVYDSNNNWFYRQ